ncbi:hypothetical protein CBM2615_A120157 [Cupriavidus taiwanensis]|uniref:Uncharacterized protein n=1 Tax=Cupriavidus taiwanensis TaxID=164546 RepID=A0A976AT54_9BURK|nr:hypothetical protein [Cupriavidus taiwanensis]SOZ49332.1 hypothetical protein CBM2615_A120157 [Cupriavidus taiwanensis]SOZ49401.1 hypothetical protein CBM2614_A120155 [Cupriavidus taiwanensis]SOZ52000.1 hypothetical protein CBM2613_A110156 [Cupriavidus taiwanensis]SPA07165.1 hypothetical protein CBM2625_A90154 [Cupriavidus taiwanensis]
MTTSDYTPKERELGERKFLDVTKGWTFDQFASLMASAVRHGIEPVSRRLKALETERDTLKTENHALRRRLDALEAEVVRMQAKSAGGMLTLAARR